jgi:hypothetical protein
MSKRTTSPQFAICINNTGYEDDLKVRTVYRILPDEAADRSHYLRIVDETGEDYLYPAAAFVLIDVSHEAEATLSSMT